MLIFNESDHSYSLDGKPLISVTQVLAQAGMVNGSFFTEESRMRGTYVHRACEMIDRQTLDWNTLDPVLLPYCEAYAAFCSEVNMETILLSEKPLYHAAHLYAGTPDRVITLNGITVLVDIKSGVPAPATAVQCAAYAELVRINEDIRISKAFALYLRDDGTYRLNEMKDMKRNLQTFLAALTVARWRKENL